MSLLVTGLLTTGAFLFGLGCGTDEKETVVDKTAQEKRDVAIKADKRKEAYEYIKIMKCLKNVINNHKDLDRQYIELILENIRKERDIFLKFYTNDKKTVVLNKIEKDFGITEEDKVIEPNGTKLYMESLLLLIRGIRLSNSKTRNDKELIAVENEFEATLMKEDKEFVEYLKNLN